MTDVIVRTPTWARYRSVFRDLHRQSLLRCLEYERLAMLELEGRVLDFGGGRRTNYAARVAEWGRKGVDYIYESANIDESTEPTLLLNDSGRIPAEDARYDAALALNTMEHVRDLSTALSELRRVVRHNGRLVLIVPFMFRVHGHPDDFLRGTPSFWYTALTRSGFGQITCEALNWGPLSTAAFVSGLPGPFKRQRRALGLIVDLLIARKHCGKYTRLTVVQDHPLCNAPLAYFIEARAV